MKMKKMGKVDPECMDIALDNTADFMHRKASELVPVASGDLRKSINVKRRKLKKSIGTNLPYAAWIEFGQPEGGKTTHQYFRGEYVPRSQVTHPLGPKPYLRPAFKIGNPKIKEFFLKCRKKKLGS